MAAGAKESLLFPCVRGGTVLQRVHPAVRLPGQRQLCPGIWPRRVCPVARAQGEVFLAERSLLPLAPPASISRNFWRAVDSVTWLRSGWGNCRRGRQHPRTLARRRGRDRNSGKGCGSKSPGAATRKPIAALCPPCGCAAPSGPLLNRTTDVSGLGNSVLGFFLFAFPLA